MSDTSSTGTTAAAPTTQNIIQKIEADLSADWKAVVSFFSEIESGLATFLTDVASGVEKTIEEVQAVGSALNGKLTTINAAAKAVAAAAPANSTLSKLAADIQTGVADAAAISTSLSSGSVAGQNNVVTTAVNAIAAAQQLATLAGQAGAALTAITSASPSATQTVSQPTPNEG